MTIQAITELMVSLIGLVAIPAACAMLIRATVRGPRPRPVTVRVRNRR